MRGLRSRLALALVVALAIALGCAGTPSRRGLPDDHFRPQSHTMTGSPTLPAAVRLRAQLGARFERMEVSTLLAGDEKPEGVVGGPLELIVAPDQVVEFHEALDPQTTQLGIVADFYRTASDPPGQRKVVVEAGCGMFGNPSIRLTPTDILVE